MDRVPAFHLFHFLDDDAETSVTTWRDVASVEVPVIIAFLCDSHVVQRNAVKYNIYLHSKISKWLK